MKPAISNNILDILILMLAAFILMASPVMAASINEPASMGASPKLIGAALLIVYVAAKVFRPSDRPL